MDAYKGYNPDSAEGKMVADMQDVILTLESLYSEALVDTSENYQTANAQKNTTWDGGAKMSIRDAFYSEVDSWDGKSKRTFVVGNTSDVLQSIGVKDSRIIWHGEKMGRIMREHSGMDKAVIKQVPQILENPVVILESKQSSSRLVIFGTVTDTNGTPVTAILELQPTNKGGQILNMNIIASAYGKDNTRGLVESSGLVYIDPNKTRTKSWMQSVGLQLPSDATILGSVGSITYPNGKIKIESVPYSQYMLNDSKKTDDVNEKFSLREPVEYTKDLVAFHNITESLLMDVLNRNSLLMPSLAVTNKGMTDFGEISLLFDKRTINPNANKENKLYGADAWTPTQTQLCNQRKNRTTK